MLSLLNYTPEIHPSHSLLRHLGLGTMLPSLMDAGDGLARHWLAFLTFEDLKTLSSVNREATQSLLRRTLATDGVWRLPYPIEWTMTPNTPTWRTLPHLDWRWYEANTYLRRMHPDIKAQLQSVAIPRSAMLQGLLTHLPSVTKIRSWRFDGDIAGIQQLSLLERQRVYKQQREIDLHELDGHAALERLELRNASLVNLHCLTTLQGLTALNLSHSDVEREHSDFRWLFPLKHLQSLNLNHTGLSDLTFLHSLPRLHTLHIAAAAIGTLEGLVPVAATLTSLDVSNIWLNTELVDLTALTELRHMRASQLATMNPLDVQLNAPQLQSCGFRYCWLEHLNFLSQCPQLQELDLRDVIRFEASTTKVASLSSLTKLQLSSNPAMIRAFDWTHATQLKALQLSKWDPAFVDTDRIDSEFLGALPNLQTLEITKLSMYSALSSPSLPLLSFTLHQLKATNAEALTELLATNKCLETLCLSAERAVTLEFPTLASPETLRDLQLTNVTIPNLEVLAQCVGLRRLEISGFGTIPTPSSLHLFLPHCQNLRFLAITQNTAFDDVSPIATLPQLEVLSVRHTDVTSIKPLANMHSLRELVLGYTRITTVSALKDLTRLQRIVLPGPIDCGLFHDGNVFPLLRNVVHEYVDHVRDCLCTGHQAIVAA